MWYRTAQLKMDPAGQMRMDMPKTKFDIEANTRAEVWTTKYQSNPVIPVIITLYETNNNRELGDIDFFYTPAFTMTKKGKLPYSVIDINRIKIDEREMEEYMGINDLAGEDVDSEIRGWGIGQYLYKLAKEYIEEHFPDAKFIIGEAYSNSALKSRNKIFGKPHTMQLREKDEDGVWNTKKIDEQQAMKKLPEATWDSDGSAYIDENRNVRIVHKLSEPIRQEIQPEDKSQLKLDI